MATSRPPSSASAGEEMNVAQMQREMSSRDIMAYASTSCSSIIARERVLFSSAHSILGLRKRDRPPSFDASAASSMRYWTSFLRPAKLSLMRFKSSIRGSVGGHSASRNAVSESVQGVAWR
eukprot:6605723-Prymnesium_polylepis.1